MPSPRPYQLAGRDFLAGRRHALLADEMRVGKTPQAILAAHKAGAKSMLVVCPAIAVPQWETEIPRWWPGGPLPRFQALSYDRARALWEGGINGKVDVFVVDEAHFAKNPDAKRTRAVYGKTGFAAKAGATWALSGTPATKHAAELWPMLYAFGATRLGYADFIKRYCTVNDWTKQITGTRADHLPELRELLGKVMLRRTRKDVAPEMPTIGFEYMPVEPDSPTRTTVPDGLDDAALLAWLEGHPTADREDRIGVARAKGYVLADEIVECLAQGQYQQTVVFGWHVEPIHTLTAVLQKAGVKAASITGATTPKQRVEIQRQFKAGELEVVLANIIAAGTAIDLSAASHGYFLELAWVPGHNMQAANRLVSMQKDEPVTFDVVTWRGTTDDRVQKVLLQRAQQLSRMY